MANSKLNVHLCATDQEKNEARQFRQKHFFDRIPIQDPYVWTFDQAEHNHFALYKDDRMVGYAHIQHWPEQRTALRIIVIDEKERNQGYGSYLLKTCEQILKKQGIKLLQTEAAPDVIEFYKHLGYTEMPFNDPDHHPTGPLDTPLGKKL
jgi:GNAT superfamily N-acetyltransferase